MIYHKPTPAGGKFRHGGEGEQLIPLPPRPPCPCDLTPVSMAEPLPCVRLSHVGPTKLVQTWPWRIGPLDGHSVLPPPVLSLPLQIPFLYPDITAPRILGWCLMQVGGEQFHGTQDKHFCSMATLPSADVQDDMLPSSWVKL